MPGWKQLWCLVLSFATRIAAADNASISYTPMGPDRQAVLGTTSDFERIIDHGDYLKLSMKHELQKRLSAKAGVFLQGEETFGVLDARYTDYKRPQYLAAVQVAEEKDVIETVNPTFSFFSCRFGLYRRTHRCQVNYARARGIQFAARAGGHSLTTSLRRIKDAIAIDMRQLNSINFDKEKQQMTVGGGVTTGEFANATHAHGMEVSKFHPASREETQPDPVKLY